MPARFETGLYGVVTRIHQRRFPVVDEERQIVFALGVFDHAGTIHELTMPDGRKVFTGTFNKPSSILITEGFKISGRRSSGWKRWARACPIISTPAGASARPMALTQL